MRKLVKNKTDAFQDVNKCQKIWPPPSPLSLKIQVEVRQKNFQVLFSNFDAVFFKNQGICDKIFRL
jgi:hypothetical protein